MDEKDIEETLKIVLDSLQDRRANWHLSGSANLKIQNVDVFVRDLDITTDDDGLSIFREALTRFVVRDFFNQKINGDTLVCDVNGFELEINSYKDFNLNMLDKTEEMAWNGLRIPVLPLGHAKKFYELINREEKADLISRYIHVF